MDTARFTAEELALCTGGKWLGNPPAGQLGVSTDTRLDNSGMMFLALKGEKFDGHAFLSAARDSGCAAFCVEEGRGKEWSEILPCLEVKDTLLAYQSIGLCSRKRFPSLRCIGVTGSVGKTSVKEMLRAILTEEAGSEDAVLYTRGNTNNQIGVVQNLLRLGPQHKFAVLEAGTSAPGEIAPLARMIRPQVGVVNSIAPCHLEKLGSLAGVAREKSAMFEALSPDGCAVFPADAAEAEILQRAAASRRMLRSGRDVRAEQLSSTLEGSEIALSFPDGNCHKFHWNLSGEHQAANAATAAAASLALGIAPAVIAAGLAHTELPGMRMKKSVINGVTYFNDAYNANPASMRASLALLKATTAPEKLVLVLGGMRELGPGSSEEHKKLLQLVHEEFPGVRLFCIGPEFAECGVAFFADSASAASAVAAVLSAGDVVFAKGSRGNAVELALPAGAR